MMSALRLTGGEEEVWDSTIEAIELYVICEALELVILRHVSMASV